MNHTSRKLLYVGVLSALATATTQVRAEDGSTEVRATEDIASEARAADARGETLATIALGAEKDATRIEFVALPDGYGSYSVGILEINRGGPGLSDIPRLAEETNPRELFHALAEKGQVEPPLFAASFAEPEAGRAGWARDIVNSMPKESSRAHYSAGCSWSSFANSFNSLRADINGTKYWYSAVDGDHDTAGGDFYVHPYPSTWWTVFASNARTTPWNNQYHNYTFYNIDKFKTRVRVCEFETGNEFQDRYVAFRYRTEGNASAGAAYTHQLDAGDLGVQFTWIWAPTNGQKNWDWVTLVGGATVWPNAHPDDRYFVAAQMK